MMSTVIAAALASTVVTIIINIAYTEMIMDKLLDITSIIEEMLEIAADDERENRKV